MSHPLDEFVAHHKQVKSGRRSPEVSYEIAQLRVFLGALKLPIGKVMSRLAPTPGVAPSFAAFAELYPTFPVYFGTSALHKLHTDKRAFLPVWFTDFLKVPVADEYFKLLSSLGLTETTDRAVGLVFPRKGVRGGLVIHGGGLDGLPHRTGSTFVYEGGPPDGPYKLTVRPFLGLVEAIVDRGCGWQRDEA